MSDRVRQTLNLELGDDVEAVVAFVVWRLRLLDLDDRTRGAALRLASTGLFPRSGQILGGAAAPPSPRRLSHGQVSRSCGLAGKATDEAKRDG